MAFLTDSSYRQLIERIEVENIEKIDKQFFVKNIYDNEYLFYFFNQFELKRLFKEKIIISGDKAFVLVYKEVPKREDDKNFVLEIKGKVKYHKSKDCVALNRGFRNFFMPEPIIRLEDKDPENHKILVEDIRQWFEINNFTVDRYIAGEINDIILTNKFNQYFPAKFNIEEITISQSEKGQFKWYLERQTTGNVGVDRAFDHNNFLSKLSDLIKKRDSICYQTRMEHLSRYDFLINREDSKIEEYILESIEKGYLKNTSNLFVRNYGIEKLKIFWEKHSELKSEAMSLLLEYFKWTYNFKENSFDEIFLKDFNVEPCAICYKKVKVE